MMKKKQIKLWFTDFWRPSTEEFIQKNSLYRLLSKRWDIILSPSSPDFLIYSCFGFEHLKYSCIRIFFAGENVRPDFDHCDYSFSFDYPVTERNYRLPLYRLDHTYSQLFDIRRPEKIVLEKQKFCCFLSSNPKARERYDFFHLLSCYRSVDSGGSRENNIGYRVTDKMTWMKDYKFSITFENSSYPGYTTEKLLHALISNTIPIYWGNPLAVNDFNPRSFINCHDYESFDAVIEVVKAIDQDDARFVEYLSQPYFKDGVENVYCREDNIFARFDQIFTKEKEFIPGPLKNMQKYSYIAFQTLKRINRFIRSRF